MYHDGVVTRHCERGRGRVDISLVVMAAGMGSRFGGIKQMEAVGPRGELLIEYSVHDAVAAGFNKVVFIVRPAIYKDFQERIGNKMEAQLHALGVKYECVLQRLVGPPVGRKKPWGTGQAVLSCRDVLDGPFAVVNADDYYGREAYVRAYEFLKNCSAAETQRYGMVSFVLKNTLSESGGVTRGVCAVGEDSCLFGIRETKNIVKTAAGAAEKLADGSLHLLDGEAPVSMNLWMFTPEFIDSLESGFQEFRKHMDDPLTDEYLLPTLIDKLLQDGKATVQVLPSHDRWFGMTFQEDKEQVCREIAALYEKGVYQPDLFSDIRRN